MAKEWSWSFSKKKNYDTCPKKFYEVDIQKNFTESTEQLDYGNAVHKALADACSGVTNLPAPYAYLQPWVDIVKKSPGKLKVEEKYAITRDFQKTQYFAHNTWYRGICDVLKINGDTATALDWKTGKMNHDSIQLMLMATCIFIHYPEIKEVKTRFVWLKENCTTRDEWHKGTIMSEWPNVINEVNAMEEATKTLTFPPRPSGLCRKHCPVNSCPFWGKGGR
jgi:hypothetical protein